MAKSEEPRTEEELSEEELRAQKGEPLPNREAMTIFEGGFGGIRPMPLDAMPPVQVEDGPVPSDPNGDLTA